MKMIDYDDMIYLIEVFQSIAKFFKNFYNGTFTVFARNDCLGASPSLLYGE